MIKWRFVYLKGRVIISCCYWDCTHFLKRKQSLQGLYCNTTELSPGLREEQYRNSPYPPQEELFGTSGLLLSLLFRIGDRQGNSSPPNTAECTACSLLSPPPQLLWILIHCHNHRSPSSSHLPGFISRKHLV